MAINVAVIGAGAAGLGVAADLRRRGVEAVVVLERDERVASSWRGRYDGLELNTVRGLSGLPRHPIPRAAGSWPSRDDFIAYLEDVARRSAVDFRFGIEAQRLDRETDGWRLSTSEGPLQARYVVVATGYDRIPRIPD